MQGEQDHERRHDDDDDHTYPRKPTMSLIVLVVLLIMVPAVAYALFTVDGSGISLHRLDSQTAPGSGGPAEPTGKDQGEGSAFNRHGTK
jgi:hypothetical protein